MSGRDALAFVRTLDVPQIERWRDDPASTATLKRVCEMALEPGPGFHDVLMAAGLGPVQRKVGTGHSPGSWIGRMKGVEMRRRIGIGVVLLLMCAGVVSAQQPAPTLKSALEAAQKAAENRRVELLKTPAGVAFLDAQEVVRQLDALLKAAAPKATPPDAPKPTTGSK
jgi:hypothetical protein